MQVFKLILALALLSLVVVSADENAVRTPSSPTISAIQPLNSLNVQLISASKRGYNVPQFELTIQAYDKKFSFLIERNDDLFTPNARVLVHNAEGEVIQSYPPSKLSYKGVGSQENSIRITLIDAENGLFKGYFQDDSEIYYIDTVEEHKEEMGKMARSFIGDETKLVIYRESDLQEDSNNPINCGVIDETNNKTEFTAVNSRSSMMKRQTSSFAQPLPAFNCPTSQKVLTMSVAADNTYATRMSSIGQQPAAFIQSQFNTISGIYQKTVNVKIQLDEIVVYPTAGTPTWNGAACNTINDKLYKFSEWRGTRNQNAGLWHLLTDCFRSGTVGLAWIGVLCRKTVSGQSGGQFVSGTGVSSYLSGAGAYRVPTHEIGHNFGAQHSSVGVMVPSNINSDVFQLESQQQMCQEIFVDGSCLTSGSTCTPNCNGKNCGSNGCGGSCGTCTSPSTCSSSGVCQSCVRNCNGKTCGSDGCGGTCGTCGTGTTCSSTGQCVSTTSSGSQQWVNLHNGARAEFNVRNVSWNTQDAAVAASWAAKCVYSHSTTTTRGNRGENIAAFSGTTATPNSAFNLWAKEKSDWNCRDNTCSNVCGHYTQIMWESTTTIGCATQTCSTGSPFGSGSWTFVVCNYAPPGNYVGQRPFDAAKCSGTCTPTTSCSAQGRTCGTINNGCQTVSCGSCGTDTTCSTQGQCVCKPAGNCTTAGRVCGSFYNGCATTNCGTCSTGSTCSSTGKCVTSTTPCQPTTTCAAQNKTCGTVFNGCENIQCGACLVGQSCISGRCTGCTGCSVYASCVNNQCQCLSGYTGDGKTCTPTGNVPSTGMDAWEVVTGTTTGWKRLGSTMVQSKSGLYSPSAIRLKNSASLVQTTSTTWRAMVRRTSTSSEAGIAFANNGKNFWALSITGSQVFLTNWTGTSRIKYLVRSGKSYPTNSWKEVKVILSQSNRATVLINGANFGTYNLQGNIRGSVGLFSISGTAQFNETLIATSSTLRISLVECLTAQQFASKIAGILGISVTQVQNIGVTSNCQKRQVAAAEGNIYTFTLVGSESASSEALASQLTTQLSINHPSIVGNGITALSAFTPVVLPLEAALVTTLPVFGATAAGLSVGAIVGIALGAAAFVALVAAVVYGAFRFHNARKEKSTNQVEMAPTAATRNYIPKNGVDLMGPKRTSITGRSPPQNIN